MLFVEYGGGVAGCGAFHVDTGGPVQLGRLACRGTRPDGRPCRNQLGSRIGELLLVQHKGRAVLGYPVAVTCEDCGATWEPTEGLLARAAELLAATGQGPPEQLVALVTGRVGRTRARKVDDTDSLR